MDEARNTFLSAGGRNDLRIDIPPDLPRVMAQRRRSSPWRSNGPRLVLLDLPLPDTDGIELIRGILDIADVPVIFLSGYVRDQVLNITWQAEADDYIVKQFSPTELAARIQAEVRKREPPPQVEPNGPMCWAA